MATFPEGLAVQGIPAEMPAPPPVMGGVVFLGMLAVYGGLGRAGMALSRRLGFPGILDPAVGARERFFEPALLGLGLAVGFIVLDVALAPVHGLGRIPHPPFPMSLGASLTAGIGEEVLFRLFFIPFWVWVVSGVLLRGRAFEPVFLAVTGASAVAFTVAHVPAVMILMDVARPSDLPPALAAQLLLLNGSLSVAAALLLRRRGFLAAVGVHFWADVGWHVLWGLASTGA